MSKKEICSKCGLSVGFFCRDESGLCPNCRRERVRALTRGEPWHILNPFS